MVNRITCKYDGREGYCHHLKEASCELVLRKSDQGETDPGNQCRICVL